MLISGTLVFPMRDPKGGVVGCRHSERRFGNNAGGDAVRRGQRSDHPDRVLHVRLHVNRHSLGDLVADSAGGSGDVISNTSNTPICWQKAGCDQAGCLAGGDRVEIAASRRP